MTERSFTIVADPVPASRPRVTSRGMAYYPKKHSEYAEYLKQFLKTVEPFQTQGPVEVRLLFVMPRYKTSDYPVHRSDVDNLTKLPLDSMTKSETEVSEHRFWVDDCLVVHLAAFKRFTREDEEPHTKIIIRTIEGDVDEHIDRMFLK